LSCKPPPAKSVFSHIQRFPANLNSTDCNGARKQELRGSRARSRSQQGALPSMLRCTEELDEATRAEICHLCYQATQEEDFCAFSPTAQRVAAIFWPVAAMCW